MIPVSAIALPHLLAAADREYQRLVAIEEAVGENWPDGFDANDIYLFADAVEAIRTALQNGKSEIDLSGKPLRFLLGLIPEYVQANSSLLSLTEYEALKAAYAYQTEGRTRRFPDRS